MSLQEIPPFFEPGAPPFTRSIVLARTEIGKMYVPDKLLAQEELGPNLIRRERSKVRFSPYPSRNNKQSAQSDSELSSLTDSDSEDDEDDESDLISKPAGEAGRPGRGGYNLEEALAWSRKEYRQLKKYVKKLVDEQLETDKNFSSQSLACIASVRSLVSQKFPVLRRYADCWPVTDLVRMELKYTCVRSRLKVQKNDAKAGRRLARASSGKS